MSRRRTFVVASAAMLLLCHVLRPIAQAAEPASAKARAKPRYTMTSGRGWGVCESYVKFLNAMPVGEEDPPLCDNKFERVPGMREPDWKELDIASHLPVVHQIELLLGIGRITPAPARDFDLWKQQFRQRTESQGQAPRLRRVRLALVPGGEVETVLSYDQDVKLCEKEVGAMKRGGLYRASLGEPNFCVFDEAQQRVMGSGYWLVRMAGALGLYLGKPYYFNLYLHGGIDPVKVVNAGTLIGYLSVKRLEPAAPSESLKLNFPDDPLYSYRELCAIQFDYPISLIRN